MNEPMDAPETEDTLRAIAAAGADEGRAEEIEREKKDVAAWAKKVTEARKFDAAARRQYAKDRTYVSGEAGLGYDVRVPIAGAYVDLLTSFLYARDPTMSSAPAASAGPQRKEMARMLAKTLDLVAMGLWREGKLKAACRPLVRSSLSVGIGWLKAVYIKRTDSDPIVVQTIPDQQDNIRRLAAMQAELASGEADDPELLQAAIAALMEGMQGSETGGQERQTDTGMVFDYRPAEDITVAPECPSLERYLDSPWIDDRMYFPKAKAREMFPDMAEDDLKKATVYTQRKPQPPRDDGLQPTFSAEDADAFHPAKEGDGCEQFICVHETWDREANVIRTWVEGCQRWARPVAAPQVSSTRFYPFFQWAPIQVDGKRHPESLPSRSVDLLDEYNRTRSNYREFRRRSIPRTWFDKGAVEPDDATRMEAGGIGEMVGLDLKGQPVTAAMGALPSPEFNPALYDTGTIRAELEIVWGIQEALSSSIRTAKTLGEAEIQQSGTEARQSFYRDSLDEMFLELGVYTDEVALQCMPLEEAQRFAGPEAFWPEGMTIEQMGMLVQLDIRAGSSSKAANGQRQERWAQLSPLIKESIMQIGQMRQSSPLDISNALEALLVETLERFGENIDPARFIPQPGQPVPLLDPNTGQTVLAYPAPQQPQQQPGMQPPGLPGLPPPGAAIQ